MLFSRMKTRTVTAYDGHGRARHGTWEVTGVRRDGTPFPMVVSTSAIIVEGFPPVTSCIVRDLSEQKRLESQLSHQALHDELTGLPNRRTAIEAINELSRAGTPFTAIAIDLDFFKETNDSEGHDTGDAVLRAAAERLLLDRQFQLLLYDSR